MKYDFYNWYNIDDSNIGCDMVIVSQCPESWSDMPNHVYKSICELIADCPAIRQLEKDCVVDFFNDDWSRQYNPKVPKYLKLNSSWCIERAPVDCPCEDEKVKAMACDDEPWYLIDKLTWWQDDEWLYWIDVRWKWCDLISLVPRWPLNPYTREKNFPATWSWNIRYKNWQIEYVPDLDQEVWSNTSYAVWYHQGWTAEIPTDNWETIWFKNSAIWFSDWWSFSNNSDPICMWTKDIIKWKWKHLFWLTRPWVYVISFNCCVKLPDWWSAWVNAIRWWLITDAWGTWTASYVWRTIGDFKYDWRDYNELLIDNPQWPYWSSRHIELNHLSFNSSYVLHLKWNSATSPVRICARVRVDTRTWWDPMVAYDPWTIVVQATNDWEFEPHSLLPPWSPKEWTNTTVTCCRVWDYPTITSNLIEES